MHDILEGTLQFEIKELLKSLIARGLIRIESLNEKIELFPYDPCDSVNKPSPIHNLSSADHSLRQSGEVFVLLVNNFTIFFISASQMWCLSRLLPLIIGPSVPDDDYWRNSLLLLKITDLIFSPVLSRSNAMYLVYLIDDYLQTFVELYPHCKIIPKQHYMVHIPQWIVRYIHWYR